MAINFSAQFIVNEKTSTRVLRLTDTSTGFTLSKGNFIITFPDGTQVANTDFANPQITAPGGNTNVSLITDVDNTVLTGTYVITYVALNTSLNEFTKTETFDFNWEKPAKAIINDSDVVLPEVQFKDLTAYETSGSFTGVLTRNFYTTTPSTSEVGVITKTSAGDILTPSNASKYYEGIYLAKSDISVAYTHTSKSWLTVAYTDLLQETFDVREAPTQDELVALMNTYKDQIEAYKSTNPSQYEIMNEQYDLVLALYSHILARYQTNTLDGSKAILDQLLGLLPPASSYTYKATQMLPFTINFSTALTGTGTTGTLPKFTGTTTLGDSIIKEDTSRIGIGKTPTTTLDVNGTIKGTSIVKDGGLSTQFLKADGSVDASAYLTGVSWGAITGTLSSQTDLQNALNLKAPLASPTFTGTVSGITKSMVGLSNVDNTTDADKPISTATQTALDLKAPLASPTFTGTVSGITKSMVGLSNVDNTSDANKPVSSATQTALNLKYDASNPSGYISGITSGQVTTALGFTPENAANKGVNNGYAGLDSSGKVPSTQLPSYVDDVLEYANVAALPTTGETGKIYITLDTNKIYRWSGSVYVEISSSAAVWGGITGTLANQTDLQNALNAKFDDPTGDTTQYIAGDGSLITFPAVGVAGTLIREVRNTTGATLTKGTVVYISGATGNKPTVSKAIATGDSTSAQTFGLVQADIAANANGNVVCVGDLTGLDTSAFTEGTQLYLSSTTAGAYTATKQLAPNHLVYIGVVTRSHNNLGQIEVNIQNGYELYELHDVSVGSYGTNDVLYRDTTTNLWKNASIASVLGYTPASTTQLALKADILNPVFTDNIYISGTNPRLYFTDTDTNPDYTIFVDSGVFYILNQTTGAFKLSIAETGNISAGVGNSMVATSFIKRGGTSSEFLMADGSVSTGAVFNYPAIGIAVSGGGGWLTSIDDNSVNWNAAYSARIASFTVSGNSGPATFSSNTLNIPTYTLAGLGGQPLATNLTSLSGLTFASTSFVKMTAAGTFALDTNTYYLASNPSGYITSAALGSYLPLSGGTLTGALLGTTASFSGNITANHSTPGTYAAILYNSSATGEGLIVRGGSSGSNNAFIVQNYNGTTTLFNVRASGDSSFSNTVEANSFVKYGGLSTGFLKADGSVDSRTFATGTGNINDYLPLTGGSLLNNPSSAYVLTVTNNSTASGANGLNVSIATGSTGNPFKVDKGGVTLFNVDNLGAALLKSTITAISFIKSSGTSSEFLKADGSVDSNAYYLASNPSGYITSASLGSYLPLSGGTLTGALGGTSATFSSSVTASGALISSPSFSNSVFKLQVGNGTADTRGLFNPDNQFSIGLANGTSSTWYIGVNAQTQANGLQFYSNELGGPAMTVTTTGRLGIGTPTPSCPLDVVADNATAIHLRLRGRAADGIGQMEFWNNAQSVRYGYMATDSTGMSLGSTQAIPLSFITNTSPKMTILSGGNVGIGTTAPSVLLHLSGSGNEKLRLETTTSTANYIGFYTGATRTHYFGKGSGGSNDLYCGIDSSANIFFDTNATTRMTITGAGNVGIGTSVISQNFGGYTHLDIGNATTGGILLFSNAGGTNYGYVNGEAGGVNMRATVGNLTFNTGATERMRITSAGQVLVSSTTSAASVFPFQVGNGTADTRALFTTNNPYSIGLANGGSSFWYIGVNAATAVNGLQFHSNQLGSAAMTLTTDGNLSCVGSVTATSFFESSDSRLKTLIEDNYYAKGIESITAKLYTKNGVTELGYYAQDVQEILPSAVTTGADGFLNLSYREVHTAKIARLEKEVEELKQKLNIL